jgi:hypothetical protein
MKRLCLLVMALVLTLPSTGCGGSSAPPPDFPNLAGAFKFVGVCSVIASCVWAYAIITSSNNKKGG